MKDLCASCGSDLRKLADFERNKKCVNSGNANVQAVHNLPEIRISEMEAERLAQDSFFRYFHFFAKNVTF